MSAISSHWNMFRAALAEEKARVSQVTKVKETAFLPAALEVVERPVSPTARLTMWVMLGGMAVLLLWLTFGKTDIVASASGRIVPADNVKLVQPAEAGVVRAILVHDGQRVKKGQPLVTLDPTLSTAEAAQAGKALETAEFDAARARAVIGALDGRGYAFVAPKGAAADVATIQDSLARAQLSEISAGIAAQSADTRVAASAVSEARSQAAKLSETLPLLDEQIAANEKLLAQGYVSKLRVIEMRRQRIAALRDRDTAYSTIGRANAQVSSAGSGVARTRAAARGEVLTQLVRAEAEVRLRREELIKSARRSSFQHLVAPVDGTVAQLAVHTEGGVVEAAKPIMVIVPDGGTLVAEVKLLNKDAGFVQPGQAVAVKLEAFPFTRHGAVPGRIQRVSPDAIDDERLGPVYLARVTLDRTTVDRGDRKVPILPGMTATADIKTGRRSFMDYLLSPIDAATTSAARER